jgi:hypothetical protein
MSRITLSGNALGTGTFTIASPNSNTDRTLTLPDQTGTLLTGSGALNINASAPTSSLTLDASGRLSVGTTDASAQVVVGGVGGFAVGGGRNTLYLRNSNSSGGQSNFLAFGSAGQATSAFIMNDPNADGTQRDTLAFGTGSTERARIDSGGNFLWQKTSVSSATNGINFENDGTNVARISIGGANSSGATGLSLYSTTAGVFRFFVSYAGQINATSTSITAISDQSLKENIRDLETGLSEVMALRPRRFDWKEETQLPDKNVAGFIAQEVEQVLPELVYDYQYSADTTKKSLKMGDILPTLVKAIQELKADLDATKAELAALKGQA